MRSRTAFLLLLLAASTVPLVAQRPVGAELFVNQTRPGRQMSPDVGIAADGSFVVVWTDWTAGRVWARRYGPNGKPRGGEFRVSRLGDGEQDAAVVGVRPDGSFVVVWNRVDPDDGSVEIYASRFDADGRRVGEPILAGFGGRWNGYEPAAVAILPDGGFFVAFAREDGFTYWADGDFPSRDLYGRRFTRDGILVGGRVTLNAGPDGDHGYPDCQVSRGQELVCTWTSELGEGSFGEIMLRRFDLDGMPLADELQVNEEEDDYLSQRYPALAIREDGTILVAWLSFFEQIRARALDATGQFLAPSFALAMTSVHAEPAAAATNDGFAVFWPSRSQAELHMRPVSVAGRATGGARIVNRRREGSPAQAAAAFGPGGGVVAWAHFQDFYESDILIRPLR